MTVAVGNEIRERRPQVEAAKDQQSQVVRDVAEAEHALRPRLHQALAGENGDPIATLEWGAEPNDVVEPRSPTATASGPRKATAVRSRSGSVRLTWESGRSEGAVGA